MRGPRNAGKESLDPTASRMCNDYAGRSASSTPLRRWALKIFGICCRSEPYVAALGAMTGNQAIQQVHAGLQAIYVSGWQVAADANLSGEMYPDQSLYPADSVPSMVRRINKALQRADQTHHSEGKNGINWFAPLIADAEAGLAAI